MLELNWFHGSMHNPASGSFIKFIHCSSHSSIKPLEVRLKVFCGQFLTLQWQFYWFQKAVLKIYASARWFLHPSECCMTLWCSYVWHLTYCMFIYFPECSLCGILDYNEWNLSWNQWELNTKHFTTTKTFGLAETTCEKFELIFFLLACSFSPLLPSVFMCGIRRTRGEMGVKTNFIYIAFNPKGLYNLPNIWQSLFFDSSFINRKTMKEMKRRATEKGSYFQHK